MDDASAADTAAVIAERRVMVNVVTAYQRVRLRLFATRIDVDWPVPLLGVLPVRRASYTADLDELESIRLVPVVFFSRLVTMAALVLTAVVFELPLVATVALGLGATLFLLLGIVVAIEVVDRNRRVTIPVCWLQRRTVAEFLDEVRHVAAGGAG